MDTTDTPLEPVPGIGATAVAPTPARSPATRLTVAWSTLLGVIFLSLGLTDLAAGLTESSRQMVDFGGGLVDARIAQTLTGAVVTLVSVVHLVVTVGVWRLRAGARDALLTMASLWTVGGGFVAIMQTSADLGARTWLTVGVVVGNLILIALLFQPAHRVDLERADARRRRALV